MGRIKFEKDIDTNTLTRILSQQGILLDILLAPVFVLLGGLIDEKHEPLYGAWEKGCHLGW